MQRWWDDASNIAYIHTCLHIYPSIHSSICTDAKDAAGHQERSDKNTGSCICYMSLPCWHVVTYVSLEGDDGHWECLRASAVWLRVPDSAAEHHQTINCAATVGLFIP